jgi:hypothetical protein
VRSLIRSELGSFVLAAPTTALTNMTPEERLVRLEEKEQEWRETVRAGAGILLFIFVLAMLSRR